MSAWVYKRLTGKAEPYWLGECALELRIPCLFLAYYIYKNTYHYLDANEIHLPDCRWGVAKGKLLELRKVQYRMNSLPRYGVKYEYTVNGQTYVSTRATTGAPYRDWMSWFYLDTITEAHYLQAIPVLRVGERCTVFYSKESPHLSALASDANSWESSILAVVVCFPLLVGTQLKHQFVGLYRKHWRRNRIRVRMPVYDIPPPPPEMPPPPTHHSPVPRN
jgi:hypothetical protein